MSAYLVSNETINCMVNGYLEMDLYLPMTAQQLGELLIKENLNSLNARYNDFSHIDEEVKKVNYKFKERRYEKEVLVGCIRCWNYQSCETDTYYYSDAYEYVSRLAMRLLADDYEHAPWGID